MICNLKDPMSLRHPVCLIHMYQYWYVYVSMVHLKLACLIHIYVIWMSLVYLKLVSFMACLIYMYEHLCVYVSLVCPKLASIKLKYLIHMSANRYVCVLFGVSHAPIKKLADLPIYQCLIYISVWEVSFFLECLIYISVLGVLCMHAPDWLHPISVCRLSCLIGVSHSSQNG